MGRVVENLIGRTAVDLRKAYFIGGHSAVGTLGFLQVT